MILPRRVSALVFDCDGLLLDTETCWSRAEASLFGHYGFEFGPAEKELLIGRSVDAACVDMARFFGRPGKGPELRAEVWRLKIPQPESPPRVRPAPSSSLCRPSRPGKHLDGDYVTDTLDDAILIEWAQTVEPWVARCLA